MSEVAADARDDAEAFARVLVAGMRPHLDTHDESVLCERLTATRDALYSEVPTRRIAAIRALVAATGDTPADEISLVRHVARGVMRDRPRHPGAAPRLDRLLTLLRDVGTHADAEHVAMVDTGDGP